MIVYGINAVAEALRAGLVRRIRVAGRDDGRLRQMLDDARARGASVETVTRDRPRRRLLKPAWNRTTFRQRRRPTKRPSIQRPSIHPPRRRSRDPPNPNPQKRPTSRRRRNALATDER